jgi:hypothetical protein
LRIAVFFIPSATREPYRERVIKFDVMSLERDVFRDAAESEPKDLSLGTLGM